MKVGVTKIRKFLEEVGEAIKLKGRQQSS